MVMYAGQVVEEQPAARLFAAPRHPYTAALLAALPERSHRPQPAADDPRRGAGAATTGRAAACSIRAAATADARCRTEEPALARAAAASVRCHYPLDGVGAAGAARMTAVAEARELTRHYSVAPRRLRASRGC